MLYQGAEVTKSLSNLIKSPFVNLEGKKAVVIDNNKNDSRFVPLGNKGVKIQTISEIEAGKALLQAMNIDSGEEKEETEETSAAEFKEGLNVTNFDKLFHEHQKKAEDKADKVLEKAREEAEAIMNEASIAAEAARNRAYEEGKTQGYEEGMAQAAQEIHAREAELEEEHRQQQEELAEYLDSVERKYVDVVISLVRKLTGVVIEDREDLILYLIQGAAKDLEPSKNYKIRVSPDEIYFLESRKNEIMDSLGEDEVFLDFVEEKGLEKGQCIIETDSQMVDCGFQTQLEMLVRDLKMLVR